MKAEVAPALSSLDHYHLAQCLELRKVLSKQLLTEWMHSDELLKYKYMVKSFLQCFKDS